MDLQDNMLSHHHDVLKAQSKELKSQKEEIGRQRSEVERQDQQLVAHRSELGKHKVQMARDGCEIQNLNTTIGEMKSELVQAVRREVSNELSRQKFASIITKGPTETSIEPANQTETLNSTTSPVDSTSKSIKPSTKVIDSDEKFPAEVLKSPDAN